MPFTSFDCIQAVTFLRQKTFGHIYSFSGDIRTRLLYHVLQGPVFEEFSKTATGPEWSCQVADKSQASHTASLMSVSLYFQLHLKYLFTLGP